MPTYSISSHQKLSTAHADLQIIFEEVIKHFDNTILFGMRTPEEQFELFKKGRKQEYSKWIIEDKSKVVTYMEGIIKKSNHNYMPSHAIDAVPYPIKWRDTDRMYYFGGFVKGIAKMLLSEGHISHEITFGGDWDGDTEVRDQTFMDLVHFELKG